MSRPGRKEDFENEPLALTAQEFTDHIIETYGLWLETYDLLPCDISHLEIELVYNEFKATHPELYGIS